ncbi:histidine phosphatase family protein [Nocardioides sp. CCNWLW239]|uniref:histidine phosphatase family protein n=1 Tax=Nocardioides sp. CCNWLW239 TaxID=3128902 RepID=UPI00301942EA
MKRRTRLLALGSSLAVLATMPLVAAHADADQRPRSTGSGYEILFVRHAHSAYPAPEEELSPTGIQQADALVDYLADERITSVDSSIMVRTYQTADGVAADHDVPVLADEDIREVELPSKDPAEVGRIMATWSTDPSTRDDAFGGQESFNDVRDRWKPWWARYVREHRNDRGTGVVVAHGGIFGLMLPETCANKPDLAFPEQFPGNTEIIKATLEPNGSLVCTAWKVSPTPRPGDPTSYYYEIDPETGEAVKVQY